MTAACQCRDCRYPAVGDPAVKALHETRHREFQRRMDALPDRHGFTPPTPRDIVRFHAGEWSVPTTCPRLEHVGSIPHPVHT